MNNRFALIDSCLVLGVTPSALRKRVDRVTGSQPEDFFFFGGGVSGKGPPSWNLTSDLTITFQPHSGKCLSCATPLSKPPSSLQFPLCFLFSFEEPSRGDPRQPLAPPRPDPTHRPPCFVLHSCSLSHFSKRNDDMPIDLFFHCSTGEAGFVFL